VKISSGITIPEIQPWPVLLPLDLWDRLDRYRMAAHLSSVADAIRLLLDRAEAETR